MKPSYFLLQYEVVPNYVEVRVPFRKEHLALAIEFAERGELILGGALDAPVDGAVLAFRALDASVPEAFVKRDPYVKQGFVTRWTIRPWSVVVGTACENPLRLESLS